MMSLPAFLLGFFGSLHCVLMCVPIMSSVQWGKLPSLKLLRNKGLYQAGRITTYIFIGLAFYLLGRSIPFLNSQRYLSIALGVLLLIYVIISAFKKNAINSPLLHVFGKLSKWFSPLLKSKSAVSKFFMGSINGLLPCGLVYLAAMTSVLQETWQQNIAYMISFGLGTLPLLVLSLVGVKFFRNKVRIPFHQLSTVLFTVLGLLFVLRGLELGIPYLSPILDATSEAAADCEPNAIP